MAVSVGEATLVQFTCDAASFEIWREIICDQFLGIDPGQRAHQFKNHVSLVQRDQAVLTDLRSEAANEVGRLMRRIARDRRPTGICAITNLAGSSIVRTHHRDIELARGDTVLLHSSEPFSMNVSDDNRLGIFSFTDDLVRETVGHRLTCTPEPVVPRDGVGRVLSDFTTSLFANAPGIDPQQWPSLLRATMHLIYAATGAPGSGEHVATSARELQRANVMRYIESRLRDPGLRPAAIAAANGMSLRNLELMFRELDTTIVATIRERRLERCREDLCDPALAHRTIMEIAEHWGFGDQAHFSRAFKKQFGMTPSDARAFR